MSCLKVLLVSFDNLPLVLSSISIAQPRKSVVEKTFSSPFVTALELRDSSNTSDIHAIVKIPGLVQPITPEQLLPNAVQRPP